MEVSDSGVAVLERADAARIKEQMKKFVHNPLPILDRNLYSEREYIGGQRCIVVSVGAGVGPTTWCSAASATMKI